MTGVPILALVGLATGAATFGGGRLALALGGRTRTLFGVGAGAVLGVAILDLAPEALRGGQAQGGQVGVAAFMAAGFLIYFSLDRGLAKVRRGRVDHRVHVGPASLVVHSLFDGVAIGLTFRVSAAIGLSVAMAVIAHDLADGANTVALSLGGGSSSRTAQRWLWADALAPLVGIGLTRFAPISQAAFPLLLAFLAGGLAYVGLAALAGASRKPHDFWTLASPALGFAFIAGMGWVFQT
jgi:ZIP family zinc transporter